MFWKFGFHAPSDIDNVVNKEGVQLTEVLDNSDVLQECKNQNQTLVNYLTKPENVKSLVDFVVAEPSGDPMDKKRFKYPNLAAEILSSDPNEISLAVSSEENFDRIWSILSRDAPLHPLTGSFFMRIMNSTLKANDALVTFLMDNPAELDRLLVHIGNAAVADVLMSLATVKPINDANIQKWLCEDQKLLTRLSAKFADHNTSSEELYNSAQFLSDIVNYARKEGPDHPNVELFLGVLQSEGFIAQFLEDMLNGGAEATTHGLSVIITVVNERPRGEEESPPSESEIQEHNNAITGVISALRAKIDRFNTLLKTEPATEALVTAAGNIGRPLGALRVKVANLLAMVVNTGEKSVREGLAAEGTFTTLLDLFFKYPDNNFFHRHVNDIVCKAIQQSKLDSVPSPVLQALFCESKLTLRILTAWEQSVQDEAESGKHRHGYMGYLIIIANEVRGLFDTPHSVYQAYVTDSEAEMVKWNSFVEKKLEPINKLHSSTPGGARPNTAGSDDDDYFFTDAEETTNAELAFVRFMNDKISDIPDDITVAEEPEDVDLISQYGVDGFFSDSLGFHTDSAEVPDEPEWRIKDGPDGPDEMMSEAEWEQKHAEGETAAAKRRTSDDSSSINSSDGNSSSEDEATDSNSLSVIKHADVALSPRSAQAMAGMPTVDPFASPRKEKPAPDSWTAFDSPQAMDVDYEDKLEKEGEDAPARKERQLPKAPGDADEDKGASFKEAGVSDA